MTRKSGLTSVVVVIVSCVVLMACTQSSQVFAPVNNVTPTPPVPAQNTLTVNVDLSSANFQNKNFSVLLFQNGALMAAQYNSGAPAITDGAGKATLILNGVDASNCPTATPAELDNGSYTLYFAIQYGAETATTINPGCGADGWIVSSSGGNLFGAKMSVTMTGDTTVNITDLNLPQFRAHTFTLPASPGGSYACYVTDIGVASYTATTQVLAKFTHSGAGDTQGDGAINYLPEDMYNYFCESGALKATGVLTISVASSTTLVTSDFQ